MPDTYGRRYSKPVPTAGMYLDPTPLPDILGQDRVESATAVAPHGADDQGGVGNKPAPRWIEHTPNYATIVADPRALQFAEELPAVRNVVHSDSATMDYPEAARVIALWLDEFCDRTLPYPAMIADAARRARKALDHADALVEDASRSAAEPVSKPTQQ